MNVSEIPQTPEKIIIGLSVVFGIFFVLFIGYTIYKVVIEK